jgi:hypothetical protein
MPRGETGSDQSLGDVLAGLNIPEEEAVRLSNMPLAEVEDAIRKLKFLMERYARNRNTLNRILLSLK